MGGYGQQEGYGQQVGFGIMLSHRLLTDLSVHLSSLCIRFQAVAVCILCRAHIYSSHIASEGAMDSRGSMDNRQAT